MNITKKALLSLIIAGALFTGFLAGVSYFQNAQEADASVFIGNEYQATTTSATLSTSACMPVLTENKTLGSVVVTLTSNAGLVIYDASTTGAYAYGASSTIASFPTTVAGTYTFDVRAKRGICVMSVGAVGVASSTITSRP